MMLTVALVTAMMKQYLPCEKYRETEIIRLLEHMDLGESVWHRATVCMTS